MRPPVSPFLISTALKLEELLSQISDWSSAWVFQPKKDQNNLSDILGKAHRRITLVNYTTCCGTSLSLSCSSRLSLTVDAAGILPDMSW